MAMDFPASPTNGQTYTYAGITYTWNGYGWIGGALGGGIMDAPSDGGEYVRVNGVWRLKSQSFNLDGLAQQDIAVPAGARQVTLTGSVMVPLITAPILRVSGDGSTFIAGATDYVLGSQPSHFSGTNGYSTQPTANLSSWSLANTHEHGTLPAQFTANVQLVKAANAYFTMNSYGKSFASATTLLFLTWWFYGYVTNATLTSLTALKALRVAPSAGAFGVGSSLGVLWVY